MADPFNIPDIAARRVADSIMPKTTPAPQKVEGQSFKEVLTESISEVQRLQTEADDTIRKLVAGEIKDVTQAMVAVERADVSFQTMMAVRNKMVQAYEEIMRMQV